MYFVYWGVFNPVTNAHLKIIQTIFSQYNPTKIFIVINTYKSNQPVEASPELRREMLLSTLSTSQVQKVEILIQNSYEYSYDQLKSEIDGQPLTAIVGADSFVKNHELCSNLDSLLVFSRSHEIDSLLSLYPNASFVDFPYPQISSSTVRSLVAQNMSISDYVPLSVEEIINKNKLYRKS
eukprot:snap_masked-scaffold_9-processed-gene-13.70-mRNA-1 protein AED:0.97 eAED:1.00 QI:0/-1/0/1/-1/1/1/0/179